MSSLRTMVDRLDEGDAFTYALVALSSIGRAVAAVGAGEPAPLRLVDAAHAAEFEEPHSCDTARFEHLLLGLSALGSQIDRLLPPTTPPEDEAKVNVPNPRDLLR